MNVGDSYQLRYTQDQMREKDGTLIPMDQIWKLATVPDVNQAMEGVTPVYGFALKAVVGENRYGYFDSFSTETDAVTGLRSMWKEV
jgi:hypothetical protein